MDDQIKIITLADYLNDSVTKYSKNTAYEIINGESLSYKQFGERVHHLIGILNKNGVKKGEKIALLGGSMPNWPVSYLAVTSSARIILPLLPDFTAFEIANILEHSGAKIIIISKRLIYKLSESVREKMELIICLDTLDILKVPSDNNPDAVDKETSAPVPFVPQPPQPEDIASIIYTSGTSGTSKGVMLTHLNITANIQMTYALFPITEKDVFLSFLPLSHAYECTLGMLYPFTQGASVYYLDGAPTPSLLLPALKKVKPSCICSVPLIVEKIYKNKVRPIFTKNWIMQILYSVIPIRRMLHRAAGKKLVEMFGGNLRFFGIGGAKLDGSVEHFLKDAGFPYAIGYGLTECSPLIAGAVGKFKFQTTGPTLKWMEMRIDNPNDRGIGEIQVKGANIMKGYYNDPERTQAAFTSDGWLKTKDLGKFDKNSNLYIKGRVDNMIIGPNGENIYPEEIEAVIRENDFVQECMVAKIKDKIVAKVYFNYEQIDAIQDFKEFDAEIRKNISEKYEQLSEKYSQFSEKYRKKEAPASKKEEPAVKERQSVQEKESARQESILLFHEKLEKVKKELLEYVNDRINKTSKISEIIEQPVPFEKTATQKIKRYLYN